MKSDEIFDGVTVKAAIMDVLVSCRTESGELDAPYGYVVEKTNLARYYVSKFIYILINEEYKDAYKKDKTAKRVFTSAMLFYDYYVRRLDLDKIAKKYTKTGDEKVMRNILNACIDVLCDNVGFVYSDLEGWTETYMIHTWQEVTENKTA